MARRDRPARSPLLRLLPTRLMRMEGETLDLIEFLLARIEDDAAAARRSMPRPWTALPDRGRSGTSHSLWSSGGGYDIALAVINGPTADHIARHDPARVLAECESKRRMVKTCQSYDWEHENVDGYARILRLLALPYAGHSDYREEWRP